MKPMIALAVLLIIATPTLADQAHASGPRLVASEKLLNRAFESCANSFLTQLFPDQEISTQAKLSLPYQKHVSAADRIWKKMEFTVVARSQRDRRQLALGSCVVGQDARIEKLLMRNLQPARFAGLTAQDVNLTLASR